jgi:hypothetical protein
MLDQDGTICFADEIMGLVDGFLQEYQEQEGPFRNELEKGLVVSYALGCIRQDTERVWDALGQASIFRGVSPRGLYEQGASEGAKEDSDLASRIAARQWLRLDQAPTPGTSPEPMVAPNAESPTAAANE